MTTSRFFATLTTTLFAKNTPVFAPLAAPAFFLPLLFSLLTAANLQATSNYVYHEATTSNPGCGADNYRSVLTPGHNQTLTIAFKAEYQSYHDQAGVYYTTDGSTPAGALGIPTGTTQFVAGAFSCTFSSGGIVDVITATIPGQSAGTTVKYIVSAWHSGGGEEIFGNGPGAGCSCGTPTDNSSLATVFSYSVPYTNTYTFSGTGDWTDAGNWSPSYPGTIIAAGDLAIIAAGAVCTIPNGTTVTIDGAMTIGGTLSKVSGSTLTNAATGSISIPSGGILNNTSSAFNNEGTLTTDAGSSFNNVGGTFTNSGIWNNGGTAATGGGSGTWANTASGTVTNTGTISCGHNSAAASNEGMWTNLIGGTMAMQPVILTNSGTLTNNGTMSTGLNNTGTFTNNNNFNIGYTSLTNANGATWTNSLGATSTTTGLVFTNSGTLDNLGTFSMNAISGLASFSNTATGVVNTSGTLTLAPDQGTENALGGQFNITGGTMTMNTPFTNNGTVTNSGGTVVNNTTYKGGGNFAGAEFNNTGGIVVPGASPGCLYFDDGYNNGTGTLQIEIGGTTLCTEHDLLDIIGTATLGGTLTISRYLNYVPAMTESYTILTASDAVSGTFSTINYPTICGVTWSVDYNANSVVVTATVADLPEIDAQGGLPLTTINDGDNTPSTTDGTDFGNVAVNGSLARMFTIFNTGDAALTITSIMSSNGLFVVSDAPTSVAANGGSETFTVTFNPNATGVKNATITINNNDCDEAVYNFAVTGTGITPGAALTFDGSDDYVNLGTSAFEFVGSFTIETWVNATFGSSSNPGLAGRIMDKGVAGGEGPTFDLYNGIRYITGDGGAGINFITAPTQVPENTWSHIAVTIDVANLVAKIYYNGALVKTQAISGDVAANPTYNLLLGATDGAGSASSFFKGKIDEFRVWNRALCQNEIQAQMNCELTGSESGLMIYYNFNQGIAGDGNNGLNTVNDVATGSGHGGTNNGTLTNFALSGPNSNWTTPGGVTSGVSCPAFAAPEADVQGGSPLTTINDGDNTPSTTDHTDFGLVAVNGSLARMFTIFNTGDAALSISIASDNAAFVVSGAPASVPANDSETFTVTFNPTATGVQNATITINSNDCDEEPYNFAIQGTVPSSYHALDFDGVNDYVDVPAGLPTFDEFTIEAWVRPESFGGLRCILMYNSFNTGYLHYQFNGNQMEFSINGNSPTDQYLNATTFTANTWYHVAAVYSKSAKTLKWYVNGVLQETDTYSTAIGLVPNVGFKVGSWDGSSRFFDGQIDEIRMWNTTLSDSELAARYNKTTADCDPLWSNLTTYWNFEENSGNMTADKSNSCRNGFITNGGTWTTTVPTLTPYCNGNLNLKPEINVQGNSMTINDGDNTPSTTDGTDFGKVTVNGSLARTFTIFNTGNAALTITSIMSSNGLFVVSNEPTSVAANDSETFTVTFNPNATGVENAIITINNNDCDEAAYDFVVTGTGATPAAALNFDGANDAVNLGTSLGNFGTGDFTVETWFKTTDNGFNMLIGKRDVCAHASFWNIVINLGKINFEIDENSAGTNYLNLVTPLTYNDNNWHHVACTRSGTAAKIYVDGVLVASGNSAAPTNINTATPLKLGSQTCGAFNGSLDEVRIWNLARSCEEIRQLRNCELTGSESGLMAYYKFNQGFANENNSTITVLDDATTNNNDGTLSNTFDLDGPASNWVAPGGVTTGTSCPASITYPEINVRGNGTDIANGDNTPSTTDHTDFGLVAVNGNLARMFTIQNTGTAALTIYGIESDNLEFVVSGAPASVPANDSKTFMVTFNPTALGVQNATIRVNNNDCDEAAYDFVVTGKGATPAAALDLSGSNDYISLSGTNTLLDGATQFTIEHWIKSNGTGGVGIVGKGASGCCTNTIHTGLSASGVFFLKVGNQDGLITGSGVVPTGTWIHLAAVYNGNAATPSERIKIYANGVLQPATMFGSIPATAPAPNVPFVIGAATSDGVFNYNGQIDEVRIWNTARTCDQITQLRNCELTGSESGLVAYYKFNQGFAAEDNTTPPVNTLIDAAGGDNNGTLNNFALTGPSSNWVMPGGVTTGTSCPAVTAPEANVQGNGVDIANGDATPSTADHTDFGLVAVNGNLARMFTIFNTGNAALTITSITSSNGLFVVSDAPTSVAANDSETFKVTFNPIATGVQTATIRINNNDCDEALYDFAVTGNGATPASALHFDGVNDDVIIPHASNITFNTNEDFTISLHVKIPSTNQPNSVAIDNSILEKTGPSGGYPYVIRYFNHTAGSGNPGKVYAARWNGSTAAVVTSTIALNDDTWHHVAFVKSGATLYLYVDGVLNSTAADLTSGTTANTAPLSIGSRTSASNWFKGDVDNLRIWNAARSCEEIRQLRNCELTGSEPNLVAYYKFNQGIAAGDNTTPPVNTLTDATANGNNGTLNGFALNGAISNWVAPGGVTTGTSCPSSITYPEVNVRGNGMDIADGDVTPSTTDHTDFGLVAVNGNLARMFTIQNTGTAALTIYGIESDNLEFVVSGAPASVPANDSKTFMVTFNPTALGVQNATIRVNNNDCDEAAYDFVVTGKGATPASALHFDGMNDNVSIPNTAALQLDQFTLETWFNPSTATNFPALPPALIAKGAAGNPDYFMVPMFNSRKIAAGFWAGAAFVTVLSTTDLAQNTWYHLATTFDGTTLKMYVNGVLENTVAAAGLHPQVTTNALSLGLTNGTQYLNGALDEVRIWNVARTCEEIRQLRNCELTGSESGLVAYYKFNQGFANENNSTITVLDDATTNNNDGTLSNTFDLDGPASNWVAPGGVTTGTSCPSSITYPEANVRGNGTDIANGDNTPSTTDHTDFGLVAVNGNLARMFTIQNTGTAALTIYGIESNNLEFVVSGAPASVPANDSKTFMVTFNPTALGVQNATIRVNNNDCDEAAYDFVVTGKGATPASALHFDGMNDYISTANNTTLDLSTQTVEFWAKPSGSSGDNDLLVGKRNYNGTNNSDIRWSIHFQNGNQGLYFYSPAGQAVWAYTFTPNQWYHIAMVTDATSTKLYIDGTFISSKATTINSPANLPVLFGASAPNFEVFPGSLDEVRIWNTARTCDQINQLRNCELTGSESGLMAYYKFNQGFAAEDNTTPPVNTLTDATANAHNGTLTGFALTGATSNWVTPGGVTTGTSCPSSITYPEVNVRGNGMDIADGDNMPSATDHTDFNGTFSRSFTIQNTTGTAILNNISIESSNTGFVVSNAPTAVAIGGSATFTVTYNPTDGTAQTSTITVNSDDCDEAAYDFVVTATATPAKALHIGTGDNVHSPSFTAFGTQPATIEFWAKNESAFAFPVGFANSYLFLFGGGNLTIRKDFAGDYNTGATVSNTGTVWEHFALTYDGNGTFRAYKNGLPTPNPTFSGFSGSAATGTLQIGEPKGGYPYIGAIDEVRMWNEQRTDAQILASYNTEISGMSPCLQVYWKLNQGFVGANNSTVTTAIDAANAVNQDGMLTNFALTGSTGNWVAGAGITETASTYVPAPEVNTKGGAGPTSIPDGDATPSTGEGTSFGNMVVGATATQTFTIENTGNLVLNVTGVTFTGTNAADFSVTAAPAATVAATNGSTTFTVQFAPTTAGTKNAVMHIANDDCDEADYDIAIQGVGTCVAPSLSCPTDPVTATTVANTCAAPVSYTVTEAGNPAPTLTYTFTGATTGSGTGTGSGSIFNKGNTTVTVTATSTCNPAATCSFTVTVTDNEKPQITCADPVTINTTAQLCTGTTALTVPTVTDNCPFGGNGLNFDGNDDQVVTATYDGTMFTGDLTVECWFNATSLNGRTLVGRGFQQEFDLTLWNNQLDYYHGNGSTWVDLIFSYTFSSNTWYHVAVVRNALAKTVSLYVNGVFQQTLSYGTPLPVAQTAAFRIGNRAAGQFFPGSMDEVRVWTVARTPAQIAGNWNKELAAQPDLFALYHLNEGSANGNNAGVTTAADASGNAKDGTLTNFALSGTTSNWGGGAFGGVTNNALATYPKGNTTVTWTATDASGNTQTCQQTVTVTDNEAPVLTVPAANIPLNVIAGTCAATYTIASPITDNCTGATWTYALSNATTAATSSAIASGSNATNVSFNKGVTLVTLNGVDAATNAAVQKTFTVTVTDNEVPKVTACFGTNISAFGQATGNSFTTPANSVYQSFTAPVTGVITSIQIQLSGGVSGLTLQVGNGISCGGTVLGSKVFNGVGGFQTITFDSPIPVTGGVQYNFGIIGNHSAGWNTVGSYPGGQMYYNGCPGSPSLADSDLVFTVNMNYVPPISLNVAPGTCAQTYAIPAPTLSDNCTGPLTWNATFSGNMNGNPANLTGLADGSPTDVISFSKGTTNVVLNGVDAEGNVSTTTCPFTVTVTDDEAPTITCAAPVTINTTANLCTGTTTLTLPTYGDNCGGTLGNALNYGGPSEVTAPITGLPTGNAARTVEFWVKITNTNQQHIISWGNFTCAIYPVSGVMRPHLWGSNNDVSSTALSVPLNTWTHVAYVLTGTQMIFYVNGVPDAKNYTHGTGNSGSLYVGSYFGATGQTVDEVRIWNTVRTQAQIQSTMGAELVGNEAGLVSYYKFNQGTAGGDNTGLTTLNATTGQNGMLTGFGLNGPTSNWVAGLTFPTLINNALSAYPKGTTTVTWTATDASGNTKTCEQTVTVLDNQAPTVTCPENTTIINTDAGASCQITIPNYVTSLSPTDNCTASVSIVENQTPTAGAYTVGVTDGAMITVTYTATDDAATPNTRTCTVTITVNDDDAPTVTCPDNTTVLSPNPGTPCSITIPNYISDLSPTDNCTASGSIAENQTPSAGAYTVSGDGATVMVTYTATDGAIPANTRTCTVTITVNAAEINVKGNEVDIADGDTSPSPADHTNFGSTTGAPIMRTFTIENLGHAALSLAAGSITLSGMDAGLFSIGNITLPATVNGPSGTVTFEVTYTPVGAGTHVATVNIAANDCNESTYNFDIQGFRSCSAASFTACPTSPVEVNTDLNQCNAVVDYAVTADGTPAPTLTYARNGAVMDNGNGTGDGLTFPLGTTMVTVTATNPCSAPTCTFNVVVTDAQKPTFTCPTPTLELNTTGGSNCQVVIPNLVALVTNAADNCALKTTNPITQSVAAGNYDGVSDGMPIPVTVTVTDNASPANSKTCVVTFTVKDNTKPTFTCPSPTLTLNTTGGTNCQVQIPDLVALVTDAADNCALRTTDPVEQSIAVGNYDGVSDGMPIPVTVTVTDNASPANSKTCVVTFMVNDNTKPTFTCPSPTLALNTTGGTNCQVQIPDLVALVTDAADNCALRTTDPVEQSIAAGNYDGVSDGMPIPVTVTVTDNASSANSKTCVVTFTVNDDDAPTVTCPPATATINTNGGSTCSITIPNYVTMLDPTDNCSASIAENQDIAAGTHSVSGHGATVTVNYTATDGATPANTKTCTVVITVNDDDAPTITCPSSQALTTEVNQCGTLPFSYSVTTTDNCSATVSIVSGLPSGSTFPVGATTVVWKTTDTGGNMTTCQFVITVADDQGPSIVCPQNISKNTDPNVCTAVVTYANPTVSDNCTGWTLMRTSPPNTASGSAFPKNTTMVTWKITDASGAEAICNFTVTVSDAQKPTIICPGNITKGTDAGQCYAVVNYTAPTATDNCGTVTVAHVSGGTSGSQFQKGSTTVTWKVTDNASPDNEKTCAFTVTVNDNQQPGIACPANITKNTDAGQCTAVTSYTVGYSDNCTGGSAALQSGLASGQPFPKGATWVTWKATDAAGLIKTCSFKVTVNDMENPAITCPSNQSVNATNSSCDSAPVTYDTPTATDNCPPPLTVVRIGGLASGSTFPLGTNTVTWRAIDGANRSSTCAFTVTVTDATPPVIACPANISVTGSGSPCTKVVTYATPTASDNCSGTLTPTLLSGLSSGSVFPSGTTVNTWRATAGNGQSSTCSFTVTVNCGSSPSPSQPPRSGEEVTAGRDASPLRGGSEGLLLHLSPNPTTGVFQLTLQGFGQEALATIFDATGRQVWQQHIGAEALTGGQTQVTVDLSESRFGAGLYMVKVSNADTVLTKCLVLQH